MSEDEQAEDRIHRIGQNWNNLLGRLEKHHGYGQVFCYNCRFIFLSQDGCSQVEQWTNDSTVGWCKDFRPKAHLDRLLGV